MALSNTLAALLAGLVLLLARLAAADEFDEYDLRVFGDNETDPVAFYYSRPDIRPPALQVDVLEPDAVTDGFIFVAPWRLSETGPDRGPYIFDNHGNLVWSAAADLGPVTVHGPHVCQYQGRDHLCLFLCFFQGTFNPGFGRGMGLIMDNRYQTVKTVQTAGSVPAADMHEFKLVDGGRGALLNILHLRPYDLTAYGVDDGTGWIVESVFQEVRVETGELLFEWRSLDHEETSPRYSRLPPSGNLVAGDGRHASTPWDYFHTNSVDKNRAGDYLISGRHFATVYKISGRTGKVEWQLRGMEDAPYKKDFNFSSQHDARWHSDNATHSVISLFDNASDGANVTNAHSRGLLIEIDHERKTARLLAEYTYANNGSLVQASSQGSVQVLGRDAYGANAFVGWGEIPFFSEHKHDGTPVLMGKMAAEHSEVMGYRAHKANWTAVPADTPALWTYSRDGPQAANATTVFYVSWNGATTVARWNFYAGKAANGPWDHVGTANKTGFETRFQTANFTQWTYAEALDADGKLLRRSAIVSTYVPSDKLRGACGDDVCEDPRALTLKQQETLQVGPPPESMHPDAFAWDAGFDGKRHYPPQPKRPTISVAAQVLPPILLGLAGFVIVLLFWVSPKVYQRFFARSRNYERVRTGSEAMAGGAGEGGSSSSGQQMRMTGSSDDGMADGMIAPDEHFRLSSDTIESTDVVDDVELELKGKGDEQDSVIGDDK